MKTAPKFAFIKACWHAKIVDRAYEGFAMRLAEIDKNTKVDIFEVPGAFEMPLFAQTLARTENYHGIVAAAFVVDGGIYRHDFVAEAVVSGLMEVQLKTDVPILSVSLTPHNFQDTKTHSSFFREHFAIKGSEAADAAIAVVRARAEALDS